MEFLLIPYLLLSNSPHPTLENVDSLICYEISAIAYLASLTINISSEKRMEFILMIQFLIEMFFICRIVVLMNNFGVEMTEDASENHGDVMDIETAMTVRMKKDVLR